MVSAFLGFTFSYAVPNHAKTVTVYVVWRLKADEIHCEILDLISPSAADTVAV